MEQKKWIIISLSALFLLLIVLFISYGTTSLKLNGPKKMYLNIGETYKEEGASARFMGHAKKVSIKGNVDVSFTGTYKIEYRVKTILGLTKKRVRTVIVTDKEGPVITLRGENPYYLKLGDKYEEVGASAKDKIDGDLSKQIRIENKINYNQLGTYEVIYKVTDNSNNETSIKRTVHIVEKEISYIDSYNNIDNSAKTWWSGNKKDQKRPEGAADINELKKYDAYFMGEDNKTIYLTFDEGSNDTYVKEIVEVLNKNNVKATFFFCKGFITSNPDLMKLLVETGHSVGNHTAHHNSMYNYASSVMFPKFLSEIREVEQAFIQATGHQMDKVYREPRGDWSYRDLQIVKDMGYKTFFWSADYLDWDGDKTKDYALEELLKRHHNGAIYLIHPKNKGNYEAMDDLIKQLKSLGYSFGLVKDIG